MNKKIENNQRTKTVDDWFDATNLDHLSGFLHVLEHGYWPEPLVEDAEKDGVELRDGLGVLTKRLAKMMATRLLLLLAHTAEGSVDFAARKEQSLERTRELLKELDAAVIRWRADKHKDEPSAWAGSIVEAERLAAEVLANIWFRERKSLSSPDRRAAALACSTLTSAINELETTRKAALFASPTWEEWEKTVRNEYLQWKQDPGAISVLPLHDDTTCSAEFVDISDPGENSVPRVIASRENYRTAFLPRQGEHCTLDGKQYTVLEVVHREHEGRHYYRLETAPRDCLDHAAELIDDIGGIGRATYIDIDTKEEIFSKVVAAPPEIGSRVRSSDQLYDITMVSEQFPPARSKDGLESSYLVGVQSKSSQETEVDLFEEYYDKAKYTDRLTDMLTVVLQLSGVTREQLEAVGLGEIEDVSITSRVRLDKRDCALLCELGVLSDDDKEKEV